MPIRTKDFLLIPNILSSLRCLAAIPAYFLFRQNPAPFSPIFALSVFIILTDFLDGYLARRLDQKSELGLILDPLGDKLIMVTTFIAMLQGGHIALSLFLIILLKDLLIALSGFFLIRASGQTPASNTHGKWASAALAIGITFKVALAGSTIAPSLPPLLLQLFRLLGEVGILMGVAFALLSLVSYGSSGFALLRKKEITKQTKALLYCVALSLLVAFILLTRLPGIESILKGA